MIDNNKGNNEMENLTIKPRNFNNTLVETTFDLGEYGTTTLNVYRYNHNPMELYEANANQPRLNLDDYNNDDYNEVALYKGIPMEFRWNPVIREMMMTGGFRIRYRGGSKPQYGFVRNQYNTLAEYADTFAIYPK